MLSIVILTCYVSHILIVIMPNAAMLNVVTPKLVLASLGQAQDQSQGQCQGQGQGQGRVRVRGRGRGRGRFAKHLKAFLEVSLHK